MHVLLWISLGLMVGVYGPRAVAWAMTIEERHREEYTGPKVTVDELLRDDFEERHPPRPLTRRDLRNRRDR